jgi:hypothetical protein
MHNVKLNRRIHLPTQVMEVERSSISKEWIHCMLDLKTKPFEGALPLGKGRATYRDSRKVPYPTYIYEWLLPNLVPQNVSEIDTTSWCAWKTVSHQKNAAQEGNPWRRSVHWISIRYALALAQRKGNFPIISYKGLQLLFVTWLTERFICQCSQTNEDLCQAMEMISKIYYKLQKLVQYGDSITTLAKDVADKCSLIRKQLDRKFADLTACSITPLPNLEKLRNVDGIYCFTFTYLINRQL